MQINLVVVILDQRWFVVCGGEGWGKGWHLYGWPVVCWAEGKCFKEKSTTKTNITSARIFIPLSIPLFVQLVKYARWLVTDFTSLTILGPVSLSHELAPDFSRFLENSNSKLLVEL